MGRKERRRGPTALASLRRSTRHSVKGTALRAMMRLPRYLRYLAGDSPKLLLFCYRRRAGKSSVLRLLRRHPISAVPLLSPRL